LTRFATGEEVWSDGREEEATLMEGEEGFGEGDEDVGCVGVNVEGVSVDLRRLVLSCPVLAVFSTDLTLLFLLFLLMFLLTFQLLKDVLPM
jgi:hypothetical protein